MEGSRSKLLDDCKSGWLMVEKDFSARLFKPEQLKYALQCMGRNPSDKAVSRYWAQCGGSMSYEQFSLVMKREHKTTMRDLMSSFRKIDLNGDGYITAHELQKMLIKRGEKMSRDEVQAVIDEADENGDGKLDYAEFAHMLLNTSEECVHAAKKKASQTTKAASSLRRKSSSSKKRDGVVSTRSFDRQRQREDIRMQLFSQTPAGEHKQETSVTDSSVPSTARQSVSPPPQSNLPPLTAPTQEPSSIPQPPLPVTVSAEENSQVATPKLEPNEVDTPKPETPTDEDTANPKKLTDDPLPDSLELRRASSLTKLPPLKNAPLPPLLSATEATTLQDKAKNIQSDDTKPSTDESPEEAVNSAGEKASPKLDQPASVGASPTSNNKEEAVSNADQDQLPEGKNNTKAAQDPSVATEETNEERQTDHLQNGEGEGTKKASASPTSVVSLPPNKPKNIESWNGITGKGCFYLDMDEVPPPPNPGDEEGVVRCHHYHLKLPSPTNVWIELSVAYHGNQNVDTMLFVFHTDESEKPTDLIAYTQHKVGKHWVCRLDLDAGTYALIPYTSRCHLKPREVSELGSVALRLLSEKDGLVSLSAECEEALLEVFQRIDLDGNGFISRTEFDFFQERTSGEICDDEAWKVIQENFELTEDDELTQAGFLDLHLMAGRDEEGGEAELREVMQALGYSNQLQLDQACPFALDVFTEDNEGEIEIVDLLSSTPHVDPALSLLVKERGVCQPVTEGNGQLNTYTLTTPHMTTIVVENLSEKSASVQLDCTESINCVFSRDSPLHVLHVPPDSTVVGFHIQAISESHKIHCIASKILS